MHSSTICSIIKLNTSDYKNVFNKLLHVCTYTYMDIENETNSIICGVPVA